MIEPVRESCVCVTTVTYEKTWQKIVFASQLISRMWGHLAHSFSVTAFNLLIRFRNVGSECTCLQFQLLRPRPENYTSLSVQGQPGQHPKIQFL